jgi:hypothetical protein
MIFMQRASGEDIWKGKMEKIVTCPNLGCGAVYNDLRLTSQSISQRLGRSCASQ